MASSDSESCAGIHASEICEGSRSSSRDTSSSSPFSPVIRRWRSRESGVEGLRIVAMAMIVAYHAYLYGAVGTNMLLGSSAFGIFLLAVNSFGKTGVAIFFLITAWYLCERKAPTFRASLRKACYLELEVLLYNVVFLAEYHVIVPNASLPLESIIGSVFPVSSGSNWYATAYILFLLVYPFVTAGLRALGPALHARLTLLLFVIWGIWYGLTRYGMWQFPERNFLYFVYLYILLSYYRWYLREISVSSAWLITLMGCLILAIHIVSCEVAFQYTGNRSYIDFGHLYLTNEGKLPVLLVAFGVVSLVVRCHRHIIAVNIFASAMFGVYLFHDNVLLRDMLWTDILSVEQIAKQKAPIPIFIAVILGVVIFGTIVDILRQLLFAMTIDKHFNTWFDVTYRWLRGCRLAQWLRASLQPVKDSWTTQKGEHHE
ncbi:acyltransferase family protein [Bifidobacterium boum]|uniref:acyltransferase family protein n=1 Tax=Bifidobacterium boum TaxID=78343 RepID=UPI003F90A801